MADKQDKQEYNSNPFTVSFDAFGKLYDYAQGVFFAILVVSMFGAFINFVSEFSSSFGGQQTELELTYVNEPSPEAIEILIISMFVIGFIIVAVLFFTLVSAAYKGFVAAGTNAAVRKKKISIGEAFSAMSQRFSTLYVAEIIATVKIIGGLFLFIVPGIRAILRYSSTSYYIMEDPRLSSTQALDKSKKLYKGHLIEVFGILTVGVIIPFVGQAIAVSGLALSAKQIEDYAKSGKQTPGTHWLNYLGFLLIAILMMLLALAIFALALLFDASPLY